MFLLPKFDCSMASQSKAMFLYFKHVLKKIKSYESPRSDLVALSGTVNPVSNKCCKEGANTAFQKQIICVSKILI